MQGNTGQGQGNQQKSTLSWSQPATPSAAPKSTPPVTAAPSNKQSSVVLNTSYTGTYVGIFVGGLIIGALIGWAISGSRQSGIASPTAASTTTTTNTSTTTDLSGSTMDSGTLTVASPQTAGFTVEVNNVQVTEPTWVVVYDNRAGAKGNALGAALFLPQSGTNVQNGTVQLLRATLPGQNYFAGQSLDDGDKIFFLNADKPLLNAAGNPLLVQFSTK